MAKQRRRLSDLYVVGEELKLDDGQGEPVVVWVQKLNPVDHRTAMKRADGERSRILAMRQGSDDLEYMNLRTEVDEIQDRDVLVEYLIAEPLGKLEVSREAELAAEEEWAKDNYLEGLREAWENGLGDKYAVDPEDREAKRVFDELSRFAEIVAKDVEGERKRLKRDYEDMPLAQLRDKVFVNLLSVQADMAWMREFRRCEIWLSVRDPDDHHMRYFDKREEVDELSAEVLGQLIEKYQEMAVDASEGKGSGEIPPS